jgi:hypothetical protein
MKSQRLLAWCLFVVWSTWMFALQSWLGARGSAARWVPDLGLVMALSLVARLEVGDVPLCALLTALSRAAFSVEPHVVVCAGVLGVFALALAARSVVELTGPIWRALVCGALVFAFDAWLMLVHRAHPPATFGPFGVSVVSAWSVASASALLAWAAGPALAHLPGLAPLRRRRW